MGKKKGMTAAEKREAIWGWAFILPTMIGLIVLNFYPVIQFLSVSATTRSSSRTEKSGSLFGTP